MSQSSGGLSEVAKCQTEAMALIVSAIGRSWKNSQHSTNFILKIMWDHARKGLEREQGTQLRKPLKKPPRGMMRGRLKAASGDIEKVRFLDTLEIP